MAIEYERIGDYDIPTLRLNNQNEYQIGFFGRRYKEYLKDGCVRHINDAASALEIKYQDFPVVIQFLWYQKASWAAPVEEIKKWA